MKGTGDVCLMGRHSVCLNSLQLFEKEYGEDGEQMVSVALKTHKADRGLKVKER